MINLCRNSDSDPVFPISYILTLRMLSTANCQHLIYSTQQKSQIFKFQLSVTKIHSSRAVELSLWDHRDARCGSEGTKGFIKKMTASGSGVRPLPILMNKQALTHAANGNRHRN